MSREIEIAALASPDDVESAVLRIYGETFLGTGLIHPTSVWRRDPETHLTIRIGPDAPVSDVDQFVLHLARARADAILTTGRILRREPELTHELGGPGSLGEALHRWRTERLGKSGPPITLVLTSGRDLDLEHPIFRPTGRRVVILTGRAGAWSLESRAADAGVEVVAADEPSPRLAIELLRSQFGCATISVEAGPTVARQYYEPPILVDELLLSVYRGEPLPAGARGLRQVPPRELETLLRRTAPPFVTTDDRGEPEWELLRYVRL